MIHKYLRAAGFRGIKYNKELFQLLQMLADSPEESKTVMDSYNNRFSCKRGFFTPSTGLTVCGNYPDDTFRIDYYYPHIIGNTYTSYDVLDVERLADKEGYAGVVDDFKMGISIIFTINNVCDILSRCKGEHSKRFRNVDVALGGLALEGTILLPVEKSEKTVREKARIARQRSELMSEASRGNKQAMDSLTMKDMDIYSHLSHRVNEKKEDILSIVESSFIPYGMESDQYLVIGEITDFNRTVNRLTHEYVWELTIECNGISFDIAISDHDLFGDVKIGRRFRGTIQMQGFVKFKEA